MTPNPALPSNTLDDNWHHICLLRILQSIHVLRRVSYHICITFPGYNNTSGCCVVYPRSLFTNDFLIVIPIRLQIDSAVIPHLTTISPQTFAHATAAVLPWHVQNFEVINSLEFEWIKKIKFPWHLNYGGNVVGRMGLRNPMNAVILYCALSSGRPLRALSIRVGRSNFLAILLFPLQRIIHWIKHCTLHHAEAGSSLHITETQETEI